MISKRLVLVDSTRAGKRIPDALSKTVPIWCSVLNRAMLLAQPERKADWDVELYCPPGAVSEQERSQITSRIDGWAQALVVSLSSCSCARGVFSCIDVLAMVRNPHIRYPTSPSPCALCGSPRLPRCSPSFLSLSKRSTCQSSACPPQSKCTTASSAARTGFRTCRDRAMTTSSGAWYV